MTERENKPTEDFAEIYEFDSFRLDASTRHLRRGSEPVKLTSKAFDILVYLIRRRGEVVSREELLKNVWGEAYVEDANLTVHIGVLRKTLGDTQSEARFIATVSRRGYSFVARAREIREEEIKSAPEKTPETRQASLAVLPFRAIGNNEELEYLADGITENLINSLSRLSQLKVLASSTVFRFRHSDKSASEIGRELSVGTILTGRTRLVGDELIVGVELVNASDERQIWGELYHQAFTDIFEVQEKIALEITGKLLPHLSESEKDRLKNRQTKNSEAYAAFLKGVHFSNRRTCDGMNKGLRYFEQAVELDADYALAHTWIALSYYFLHTYFCLRQRDALPQIHKAINRAFEINPNLAEAHTVAGLLQETYEWNWAAAEREYRLAIELDPNNVFARRWYVGFLRFHKRFDEVWRQVEDILQIDPISMISIFLVGNVLYYERRFEESIAQFKESSEIFPNHIIPHVFMASCYQMLGDYETGLAIARKVYEIESDSEGLAFLGIALAYAGQKDEARQIAGQVRRDTAPVPFELFYLYIALGEADEALDFFEESLSEKVVYHFAVNVDARADAVRSHPKFQAILKRMGFN
jgi:DNA-binding winged helix-turn-helix (wHTH) protein